MEEFRSPFSLLPADVAFNLGITLVVISTSILFTHALRIDLISTQRQQAAFSISVGAFTFWSIRSSMLAQQVFSYLTLAVVVTFPVVVCYLGLRELLLNGVYGP